MGGWLKINKSDQIDYERPSKVKHPRGENQKKLKTVDPLNPESKSMYGLQVDEGDNGAIGQG